MGVVECWSSRFDREVNLLHARCTERAEGCECYSIKSVVKQHFAVRLSFHSAQYAALLRPTLATLADLFPFSTVKNLVKELLFIQPALP